MNLFVYVDNSNLWIEGMRVSAVRAGLAASLQEAIEKRISDQSWAYDFGRLHQAVCPEGQPIGCARLYGSRPPANDSLWQIARDRGFDVVTFDRNSVNKEKQVDVAIATQIMEDSYELMHPGDRVLLVSGDRDYVPTLRSLKRRTIATTVAFWSHATAHELKVPPVDYFSLDDLFDYLSR